MAAPLPRLKELDILRGLAIVMVVLFHLVFDLHTFFGFENLNTREGFWFWEGRTAALLFIGLAGAVTTVIGERYGPERAWRKNLRRGGRLIGLGMLITLATWIFDREWTVWFGILHFLGVTIILSSLFLRFRWLNIPLALLIFGASLSFEKIQVAHYGGLIFGIPPPSFQSFDYYPLFPWFGVVLIGMTAGKWIAAKKPSLFTRPIARPARWLGAAGRYSLWIYLVHQPLLLGILSLIL